MIYKFVLIISCILFGSGNVPISKLNKKTHKVDLVIYEHYYHGDKHIYDELIFFEYSPDYRRYHVRNYYVMHKPNTQMRQIYYQINGKDYFKIVKNNTEHIITTDIYLELDTRYGKDLDRRNLEYRKNQDRNSIW